MQSKSTKHGATPEQLAGLARGLKTRQAKAKSVWLADVVKNHSSDMCILWPFSKLADGYGSVRFHGKVHRAHRVAFFIANGHWPNQMSRHTCDTPLCINPRHLLEGSNADNTHDKVSRNRVKRGESTCASKLTEDMVRQIRKEHATSTNRKLAAKFGVVNSTIFQIVHRNLWSHID